MPEIAQPGGAILLGCPSIRTSLRVCAFLINVTFLSLEGISSNLVQRTDGVDVGGERWRFVFSCFWSTLMLIMTQFDTNV